MHLVDDILSEAVVKFVTRVRNGKIQRRARVKAQKRPGYKLTGNRVVRESPTEKRNRHRAAIRAARKRRSKRSQSNRKRKRSLVKRARLHIRKPLRKR